MMKGGETCDDGNTSEGDGCSRYCLVEPGWDCTSGVCVRLPAVDGGGDSGTPVLYCGDGIRSGAEECDWGQANSNSVYGGCSTQCMFVYCGDGILNGDEECDLGDKNGTDPYTKDRCTISCQKSHFCGDGIVDTNFGEDCDLGDRNGLTLDQEGRPSDSPSAGVWCTVDCAIPHYVFP
jgi:large repetitive protein